MYKGECFNSISHLFGAITALAGLVIVVIVASKQGDPWKIVSLSIYGTTLFFSIPFQRSITAFTVKRNSFSASSTTTRFIS
jgi:predicted membrane channel-forming protein YqfA (hemolysin III family)